YRFAPIRAVRLRHEIGRGVRGVVDDLDGRARQHAAGRVLDDTRDETGAALGEARRGRQKEKGCSDDERTKRTEHGASRSGTPVVNVPVSDDSSNNNGDNNPDRTGGMARRRSVPSSASRSGSFQRGAIENTGGLVADLLKDPADGAILFRHAFFARGVSRLADAGDEGERAVERADDVAHADVLRRPSELVPAAGTLPALDEAAVFERHQDVLEELLGDRLALGEIADEDRAAAMFLRQRDHRLQPVLSFPRQHEAYKAYLVGRLLVKRRRQRTSAGRGHELTSAGLMRLSRDWWAVLAAAAAVILIKLGVVAHIPW